MSDIFQTAQPTQTPLTQGLTPPQLQAVQHVDGPVLVLAGPGSGKTRVITHRIAHLVKVTGVAPWNVLAITFTNKAAKEMRNRMEGLLSPKQVQALTVTTFHSLCARLLRQYSDLLNLPSGYSIYDSSDQKNAVKSAITDLGLDPKNFPPAKVLGSISDSKNQLIGTAEYEKHAYDYYSQKVAKIYKRYEKILKQSKALDFDDLLVKGVELMKKHPQALEQIQERFGYILIDEYQDTNEPQFRLANYLAKKSHNIMAVGDPDQSIYGWRGANIKNILNFETLFPEVQTIRLEQNYRSTKNILNVADTLIKSNTQRKHKTLWTDNPQGDLVNATLHYNAKQESQSVAEWFLDLNKNQGTKWSEMAVFYRTNSLSREVEDALRAKHIPYQIAKGTSFYGRKEIKDALAFLHLVTNPADEVSLKRIINVPARGISIKTIKAVSAYSFETGLPFEDALRDIGSVPGLTARAQNAVNKFLAMVDQWRKESGMVTDEMLFNIEDPFDFSEPDSESEQGATQDQGVNADGEEEATFGSLRLFLDKVFRDSGYREFLGNDKADIDSDRLANLGELLSAAGDFDEEITASDEELEGEDLEVPLPKELDLMGDFSLESDEVLSVCQKLELFLEKISLISDVDAVDATQGMVTLMTLHASKGLEFDAVALVAVEDGLLPHKRAEMSSDEMEEERRLMFVGVTRAKKYLSLNHTRFRTVFGQTQPSVPSRFYKELPEENLITKDATGLDESDSAIDARFSQASAMRKEARDVVSQFPVGSLVRHPKFGLGRILSVGAMGAQTRASVQFNTQGKKTLILQYAKLERIEADEY